nr:MAG TPA: protein of unknown function DUF285 [Caudoviricetes sp.]
MYAMFSECKKFEGKGIENWNVSNVVDMRWMFGACSKFRSDLSGWDVLNVIQYSNMFAQCPDMEFERELHTKFRD